MFKKLDIIGEHRNQVKIDFRLQLLNIFLEEKRWIHANPTLYSKGKHKDKYKEYYVEDHALVESFFQAMLDKRKFVILQGKRGSGKTSFLNFFLNKKTRELNSKNLTWVRIDTTKMYKNRVSFIKNINFEIYLYAQLLFVYFRYKGNSENNSCTTDFRCPGDNNFQLESCDNVFREVSLRNIIKGNDKLNKMYDEAKEDALKTTHYNNSYEGKCFECSELGKILFQEMANKLIVIIDGIDNINYNSSIRHEVWSDLEKFLNKMRDVSPPHKLILALRTENYTILSAKLKYLDVNAIMGQGNIDNASPHFFNIVPIPLKKIIEKFNSSIAKVDISNYSEKDYLETLLSIFKFYQAHISSKLRRIKKDLLPEEYIQMNQIINMDLTGLDKDRIENQLGSIDMVYDTSLALEIKKSGYPFIEKLEKAMHFLLLKEKQYSNESFNRRLKEQTISNYFEFALSFERILEESLVKYTSVSCDDREFNLTIDLFNGDLRELFILSYRSYTYFVSFSRKRSDRRSYDNIFHYMREWNLVIVRAAYQNGNLYYSSRDDIMFYPPYRNINFINLFNLLDSDRQVAPPLASLYLLKYLYSNTKSDKQISTLFSDAIYDNFFVGMILNELLEFGYIGAIRVNDSPEIHYTATSKGKNILDYSLTNLNVIQSYIYGGLVESAHEDYYRVWHDHNYASELLFNVLLYWYELQEQENELQELRKTMGIELELIPESTKEAYIKLSRSFPELYALRNIDTYTKQDKNLAKSLKELHRKITFEGAHYDKLYTSIYRDEISARLMLDEKIIYASHYLGKTPQEIIDDAKLHNFVFGDIDLDKENERLRMVEEALNSNRYWSNRDDLMKKLDKIKKYIM